MRVLAAMSGGVDSSVAALELKRKGYDVIGVTIKTWPKEECGASGEKLCCSLEAIQFARSVAEEMEIPYYVVDLSKDFADIVKKYFVDEYCKGRTPNPCVFCNSKIKFGALFKKARELGAEKIATGHYARILKKDNDYFLAEGKDKWQDQSYFLYDIDKDKLPFIEFPLGCFSKNRVKELAMENSFLTADRKPSQDICFATQTGGYKEYLENLGVDAFSPGNFVDIYGNIIGEHKGIAAYTVGQRKGIGIAGPEPVYVIKIDPGTNTITVGEKEHTMKKKIRVSGFNFLTIDEIKEPLEIDVRIRYKGNKIKSVVTPFGEDEAIIEFSDPQFAPSPGQAAVFYNDDIIAGGAWIEEVMD